MRVIFLLLLISTLIFCCPIVQNNEDLIDLPMTLLDKTQNGEKYVIGDLFSKNRLFVLKLKGTSYQMGRAYGQLFKTQILDQIVTLFTYFANDGLETLKKKLPKFITNKLTVSQAEKVFKILLDMNYIITKKYTNNRYYQEIKGIADGSGFSERQIRRLNLFPELIKGACTVAGLWGAATLNGQTLHLRSLDWDKLAPMNKYPLIITYFPSESSLFPHINFAWVGMVGSLTGISQTLSLGQKVWIPPAGTVQTTRYGNPWIFVLRDVLYQAKDLNSALKLLNQTHRTCAIHLGIASKQQHSFRMIEYAYKTFNSYDDRNYNHYDKNHPQKDGVAYWDKFIQPSQDSCVGSILTNKQLYSKWEAQSFWRIVGLSHETGDTQLAVFDLQNNIGIISYSQYGLGTEAYKRNPIKIDLKELFIRF